MSISVPPQGNSDKKLGAYFAPLRVEAQDAPNLTVKIRAGSFWTSAGEHREYAGGNSPVISAPASLAKWVVVTINENGVIANVDGAASANPELPALADDQLPLAAIYMGDTATEITNDMVFDIRPLWSVPAPSVDNLQGELDDRPTFDDLNSALANKADTTGTTSPDFTLNSDQVGVPATNANITVTRGSSPTVAIRWNETTEKWEFTNDGTNYADIGTTAGSFYTQTQLDNGVLDAVAGGRYYTDVELDGGQLDTRYYTETEVDALLIDKANAVHNHVAADVTDFDSAAQAAGAAVFAPSVHTHVKADITDFSDGDYATAAQGALADSASQPGHTHVAADVTDFTTAADARIAAANVGDLNNVSTTAFTDGEVLVWSSTGGFFANRKLATADIDDVDTVTTPPVLNDVLVWNGVNKFENRALVKGDISDFTDADYVTVVGDQSVGGNKTFTDNVIVTGDLTVNGTTTAVNSTDLFVEDNIITVNSGETGAGVSSGNAGIEVERGTLDNARIIWDEAQLQWQAGVVGSSQPILLGVSPTTAGNFASLNAAGLIIDSTVGAADFATAAQGALADTASQPGHTHVKADITDFSDGDYATSAQGALADTATQPGDNVSTLANDANYQSQVVPATAGDFAALDASGNIIDSGSGAADFATAVHTHVKADITDFSDGDYATSAQGALADSALQSGDNVSVLVNDANYQGQVVPATAGDFAALDASGNIIDSAFGSADFATSAQGALADSALQSGDNVSVLANDSGYTTDAAVATNHYTKTESDAVGPAAGAKVDKVTGVSGNVVEFGASNAIADSGVATSSLAPIASPTFTGVPVLPTYTVGALPAVGSGGGMIYVSDATGASVTGSMCFSNGTSWIDVTTGIAVV